MCPVCETPRGLTCPFECREARDFPANPDAPIPYSVTARGRRESYARHSLNNPERSAS
jgi:hypothetical protein